MKAIPLSFEEFQGKGALDFTSSSSCSDSSLLLQNQQAKWQSNKEGFCYVGSEPTSRRSPSPPTSSSTLSSSFGESGGGGSGASTDCSCVAATKAVSSINNKGSSHPVDIGTEKCGLGMEDWESILPGSPSQDQSILRLIMGDVDDPSSMGLNKILQPGGRSQDMEFNAGFGLVDVDQGFSFESNINPSIDMVSASAPSNPAFTSSPHNLLPTQQQPLEALDGKPQLFNPQMIMNQNQNPAMFFPLSYAHFQEHNLLSPPPPKRLNSGSSGPNF
ncbi:hypothetical protein V6N13_093427 [Hibiscus sabdariffa]|uniref:Uncharacterized protein n=2 Tax=Hibiscus sabdariffa TaxID=183260 RepID=A0ABR2BSG8_9ROSI